MFFEWDDEKARKNLQKHGVDFRDAIAVFDDPYRLEWYDTSHSEGEDRYDTIGLVRDVLFVVYTERQEVTRIISARKATSKERSLYFDRNI